MSMTSSFIWCSTQYCANRAPKAKNVTMRLHETWWPKISSDNSERPWKFKDYLSVYLGSIAETFFFFHHTYHLQVCSVIQMDSGHHTIQRKWMFFHNYLYTISQTSYNFVIIWTRISFSQSEVDNVKRQLFCFACHWIFSCLCSSISSCLEFTNISSKITLKSYKISPTYCWK